MIVIMIKLYTLLVNKEAKKKKGSLSVPKYFERDMHGTDSIL